MENFSFLLRKDILDLLNKRISDFKEGYRQNVAILGNELIGKTTLLKTFLNDISDEKLVPIYVDIIPFEFSLFIKRFMNSLLYNFLKKSQLVSSRESLDILVKRSKEFLPQTTTQIEHFLSKLEKEKPEILFKELFAIIESFSGESRKQCIIIFDEFQNLKKLGIKNICQELGKKIMFEKNTLFIFSSSLKNEAKEILANDLSLLFGNFETIELQMLNPANCDYLITNELKGIAVSKEFIDFLINFTGGHPFYLKILCDEASSECRASQKETLDKDTLSQTLEKLLFNDWGIFNLKFTTFLSLVTWNRNKNDFVYLLDAISIGKNRLKDLMSYFRKPRTELIAKLNRLIELDVLSKNGSFYCINDRLMSFWLKFVHFEKLNSLSPDYTEQALHFRSKIHAEIDEFIHTSKKNIADRMLDLFNLFEEDDIQIDRKKIHLSPFKELKIISFDDTNLKIGIFGKAQDSLWLAAIKEDGINEHDVNEFLKSLKRFKHKTINKIIIGLGDIERNARLLAKESHIITWDIASINNLFDLYGKPRIIK